MDLETLIPIGIVIVCLAGAAALIAMALLFVSLKKQIEETMGKVNPLIDEAQKSLERVDPLLERITLMVDAANLEIMRVDQIMEDVATITGNVSSATESLESAASAPFDAISNVTGRIRSRIAPLQKNSGSKMDTVISAVDSKLGDVEDMVALAQVDNDIKRAEAAEAVEARNAAQAQANLTSANIKTAVSAHTETDTDFAKN